MKNIFCISIIILFTACKQEPKRINNPIPNKQKLQELNQAMAKREHLQIKKYIERKGWDAKETGTGLFFYQYQEGSGDSVFVGDRVEVNLIITLLNGDTCYDYHAYGSEKFMVERQSIETGLHEVVQKMRVGAKAKAVLPSHLAHGVVGDMDKIPQRATVVYDVELLGKLP